MATNETKICNYKYDEFLEKITSFHGGTGPGLIIGGFMVDLATKYIPVDKNVSAICETGKCLPDAIQLLTHCTIGNVRLILVDTGRFAMTLYDRSRGEGVRVFVAPLKLENWQEVKKWFFNLVPKEAQDLALLLQQIKEAGADICSLQHVKVEISSPKIHGAEYAICPRCKEAYQAADGKMCPSCQEKKRYYSVQALTATIK
jgi:formylmethanofuran dehydrogenase subunit E